MRVVALVPARGGSKGIRNKNLQQIVGIPLVARSVLATRAVPEISKTYVSSDSVDILNAGRDYGAEAIERPPQFAADESSTEDVLIHFLDELERRSILPDVLVYLQCTSPFTTPEEVSGVLQALIKDQKLDCAFSAIEDHAFLWRIDNNGKGEGVNHAAYNQRKRRQDLGKTYKETGAVYALRVKAFKETKNRFGRAALPVSFPRSLPFEIDDPFELSLARHVAPAFPPIGSATDFGQCRAIVMDFDGVHTNDKVTVSEDGKESVVCTRADGIGIGLLKNAGYRLLILTREDNPVVRKRAAKLDVEVIYGQRDKLSALKEWAASNALESKNIAYVGNDVNDLDCLKWAEFSFVPSDAHPELLMAAKVILAARGGDGVIRELADVIIFPRKDD